jgi:glycosyltransferase family protein
MEKSVSRVKQTEKNVIFGFVNKFVMLLLTFISKKFFLRFIGVEYLGINSLFSNILSILCLADLGLGVAMTYSFYKPLSDNDEVKITSLVNFYKIIYRVISFTVFAMGMIAIPFLKFLVKTEEPIQGLYFYYILFVLQTCASYLFVYKTTLLISDQRNYICNIISTIVNIVKVSAQIIIIYFLKNYYIYIFMDILGVLASNIILSVIANKKYPFLKNKNRLDNEEKKPIINNLKSVFLYKLSAVMINSTDNIIISVIFGTAILGYYSNYYTIINQLSPILTIIFSALTSSLGNLIVTSNEKKQFSVFKISMFVSNYLGLVLSIGFMLLCQDFIVLWLGKDCLLDNFLVISLSLNLFYSSINQPIWTYREASGLYQKTKYIMLITAITNIILSIIFAYIWGISGVILATFVSKLCVCFWYEPIILFKDYFKMRPTYFFINCLKEFLLLCLLSLLSYFSIKYINISGWIGWFLKAIIVVSIITIIYLGINWKTSEFQYFDEFIKKKGSKNKMLLKRVNKLIKNVFSYFFKRKAYRNIQIMSPEETIRYIITNKCSVSRFGDGEMLIIDNESDIGFQTMNKRLSLKLRSVLDQTNNQRLLICIPRWIFKKEDLKKRSKKSQKWCKKYLRTHYLTWCNKVKNNYVYGDTSFNREYIGLNDKSMSSKYFEKLKEIWDNKDVCFIEGEKTKLGVGNNLFDNAKSIKRIIAPSENAFEKFDEIIKAASNISKKYMFLCALGPTATVICSTLSDMGFEAIDIGHIDVEYEWFKMGAKEVVPLSNKYVNEAKEKNNIKEEKDPLYEMQIVKRIY